MKTCLNCDTRVHPADDYCSPHCRDVTTSEGRDSIECPEEIKTQENDYGPQPHQIEIELNGEMVWVDHELKDLLIQMNKHGLITRSHCSGHGNGNPSWVVIRCDNFQGIEIRNKKPYNEIVISWHRHSKLQNKEVT